MILGPVSLIDCLFFCLFLAPQLLIHVGLFRTIIVAVKALPFICIKLPLQFVEQRCWSRPASRSAFVRESSVFEYLVIRCVRYGFRNIPADIARVFFAKKVALPFTRWRMLRHGYLRFPVHVQERTFKEGATKAPGIWIKHQPEQPPDFAVYFVHGGGFAMGTCYFYLEFLMSWHHLLLEAGYKNPAIFALDYTLVPDDIYPRQVQETLQGYEHTLEVVGDASKVCVAGDSAGGTLILSLLLELGAQRGNRKENGARSGVRGGMSVPYPPALAMPRMATLISPWVTLMSDLHYPSADDFLDRRTLWKYAHEYAGESMLYQHPASPGNCLDEKLWKAATPSRGYFVVFGEDEVFAPDIETFIKQRGLAGAEMEGKKFEGGVHAWPVASLFLSSTNEKRLRGLRSIVASIRKRSAEKLVNGVEKAEEGWSD